MQADRICCLLNFPRAAITGIFSFLADILTHELGAELHCPNRLPPYRRISTHLTCSSAIFAKLSIPASCLLRAALLGASPTIIIFSLCKTQNQYIHHALVQVNKTSFAPLEISSLAPVIPSHAQAMKAIVTSNTLEYEYSSTHARCLWRTALPGALTTTTILCLSAKK